MISLVLGDGGTPFSRVRCVPTTGVGLRDYPFCRDFIVSSRFGGLGGRQLPASLSLRRRPESSIHNLLSILIVPRVHTIATGIYASWGWLNPLRSGSGVYGQWSWSAGLSGSSRFHCFFRIEGSWHLPASCSSRSS
jgi:hypothetical protein